MDPELDLRFLAADHGAIGRGVEVRIFRQQECIRCAEAFRNRIVQIRAPLRDDVDDHQARTGCEIVQAFTHERLAFLGAILVGRAHEFDGTDECAFAPICVNADFRHLRERIRASSQCGWRCIGDLPRCEGQSPLSLAALLRFESSDLDCRDVGFRTATDANGVESQVFGRHEGVQSSRDGPDPTRM